MTRIDVEPVEDAEGEREGDDAALDADSDADVEVDADADLSVDVEAVDSLPEGVDAPEYVLYGGKGGVGKTTMAAATALSSAADGTPTLVVSTDPAHSLSDTLETDVPAEPARVRDDVPLFAAEIDPDDAVGGPFDEATGPGGGGPDAGFDDPFGGAGATDRDSGFGPDAGPGPGAGPAGGDGGGRGQGPFGNLGGIEGLFGDDGPLMGGPMPGADEAAAMQQLLRYLDDPRFERVVVDTAPTGHTLRLLELPEVMDTLLGRLVRMKERLGGMMDGLRGMFGLGDDGAESADLGELRERIERLRAVLRDPDRTDFRVVMVPEGMSVVETDRLVERLDEYGIPVQTVVVNRVMENLADIADVDGEGTATGRGASVDSAWVVSPDLDDCEFCQRRWQVQQSALREATGLFRGRTVKRVPLLADEVRGEAALRVVAACLA